MSGCQSHDGETSILYTRVIEMASVVCCDGETTGCIDGIASRSHIYLTSCT